MARRASALLLAGLVLAGCMGSDDASVERNELAQAVLQPRDLSAAWVRFDHGRQGRLDGVEGNRGSTVRFGRIEGWKARYRRPGSPSTSGPLVIESRAELFEDDGGAERELAAIRDEPPFGELVANVPKVGQETIATSFSQGGGSARVRFWFLAWRHANVTASLLVNGFDGKVTLADVAALARKQQARMEAAAA